MDTKQNNSYLHFIPFKDFFLWDTKRYTSKSDLGFENAVALKDILTPYRKVVSKEKMIENKWQIISKINFSGNLFLRDFEQIHTYKGNLNIVPADALIYSKINVRHGCIYYHEENAEPFGVSNEYPTYKVNHNRVFPQYLVLLLRSSWFKNLLNTKTSGISKARVKEVEFLDVIVPLPSIEDQKQLVEKYNVGIKEVKYLKQKAVELEKEIDDYFLNELNIKITTKEKKDKAFYFANYAAIDRWDVWVNNNLNSDCDSAIKLKDLICGAPQYGANVKGIHKKGDTRYIRITDINESGELNSDFVSPEYVEDKYLLTDNDFLIARSGNTVGKTFLYKESHGRAVFAGYLVKYIINVSKIIPEYLLYYTKSRPFKNWIQVNQRVSGQPNINGKEFLSAPIPLPTILKQKDIVNHIKNIKDIVKKYRTEAENKRVLAIQEFENEIFQTK